MSVEYMNHLLTDGNLVSTLPATSYFYFHSTKSFSFSSVVPSPLSSHFTSEA